MKDAFGNEYVKPAACSHPACPPWQCMQLDLSQLEPLPPESSFSRNLSPEERARVQRETDERNRTLEAHRKKHSARRLIVCAILASLPGLGLFLMFQQDAASKSMSENISAGIMLSLVLLGFLYPMSLLFFRLPPAPTAKTRRPASSR